MFFLQLLGLHGFIWLVVSTPLQNISQLGLLFPIYGTIKMIQTTNQLWSNYSTMVYHMDLPDSLHVLPIWTTPWLPVTAVRRRYELVALQWVAAAATVLWAPKAEAPGARSWGEVPVGGHDRADRKRESSATANPKLLKPSKRFRKAVLRCPKRHASANYSGLGDKTTQSIAQSEAPAV